jgi:NAD(P)-dependent dehydrogenase (short-subunit alcohol dehydrogenase family)
VSSEEDVSVLVQHCIDLHGRLDCAFNNAGISPAASPLHDIELDAWRRTLDVNLTGVFLCMKYEIPVMQKQGGGAIVNTASGAGLIATPWMSPYCASKHAILGITKTAAVENALTGVRVNAVLPGSTDTPMLRATMDLSPSVEKMVLASQPGGRLGRPEEIAAAAAWLCSDRASFVSGESMLVDGAAVAR